MHTVPEQQPLGHDAALQLAHTPAVHSPEPHVVHAAPPVPHAVAEVPAVHVVPWQHPLHELGSQTHAPPEQRWPVVHAGPLPHVQLPVAEQPSASADTVQSTQLTPPLPHVDADLVAQAPARQQPDAHEVASHTHAPDTQR